MTPARNPRTGRFERDPLTSPITVDPNAPTPIWDALMAEQKTTPAPTPPPVRRVSWRERFRKALA